MTQTLNEIRDQLSSIHPSEEQELKTYAKVFKPEYQRFLESDRFKVKKAQSHDYLTFGRKLARQASIHSMANEAVSFSTQMPGTQTVVGLDYVTTNEIQNILPLICADQVGGAETMNDKLGIVRYENITAVDTRGNVTAGDLLQGAGKAPKVYPAGYAGEMQYGEEIDEIATGETDLGGTFEFKPIRAGYVKIVVPGAGVFTDDNNGHLVGDGGYGTVNYTTGVWAVKLANAPVAADNGKKVLGNYAVNYELGTLPSISLTFDAKVVQAQVYGLQSDTSILTQYLMQKTFNYNTQKRANELVTQVLLNEMVTDLIRKVEVACVENSIDLTQFSLTKPDNITQQAHNETIDLVFNQIAQKLAKRSSQGDLSVALAGPDAVTIYKSLHKFVPVGKISAYATLVGVYDNTTLVFNCPQLSDPGKVYFLNKGDSQFLAAAVNMVAMPLVSADDIPVTYNLTQRRTGVFTLAAIDVLVPGLIQQLKLANTPYPVGA